MRLFFAFLLAATASCALAQAPAKPIEVKVVVVSMFEVGADTGDVPGEYQFWVEREHLDTVLPFAQGYHDLRLNAQTGVLGLLTGAGIAGINPALGSLGSAVWSDYIVDGDLAHEIDAREIPQATPEDRKLWTT